MAFSRCYQIIPLLSHQNDKIAQEALALIKVMLFSGNEEVQRGIELNARETREETLFLYLKSLFEDASRNYKDMYEKRLLYSLNFF